MTTPSKWHIVILSEDASTRYVSNPVIGHYEYNWYPDNIYLPLLDYYNFYCESNIELLIFTCHSDQDDTAYISYSNYGIPCLGLSPYAYNSYMCTLDYMTRTVKLDSLNKTFLVGLEQFNNDTGEFDFYGDNIDRIELMMPENQYPVYNALAYARDIEAWLNDEKY
jgi:hypothetical protein